MFIYDNLIIRGNNEIKLARNAEEMEEILISYKPDYIFFIGWSSILEKDMVDKYYCICLHPSALPLYRGGSPIQHQIIRGETESAVTLFQMDEKIDQGPILFQKNFSLDGNLDDIFSKISLIGIEAIQSIMDSVSKGMRLKELKQDDSKSSYYRRRKPFMSEIRIDDFKNFTASQLYNKIRALQDPYPNAFIKCKDGSKLYIFGAKIDD